VGETGPDRPRLAGAADLGDPVGHADTDVQVAGSSLGRDRWHGSWNFDATPTTTVTS
jgi:hypothetical protein